MGIQRSIPKKFLVFLDLLVCFKVVVGPNLFLECTLFDFINVKHG